MKKKYKILIAVIALLLIIRIILPYIMLHYANNLVANLNGYYGHIDDLDVSLYRGAYTLKHIYLDKVDSTTKKETKFFRARAIDISLEWGALIHGAIVGKLIFDSSAIYFTKNRTELSQVKKDTSDFGTLLSHLMPLTVNRFEINNGFIHYIDNTSNPKVDISLKRAHVLALNLTNVVNKKDELPASVTATASVYEGDLVFNMKLNPLSKDPLFELNASIKNTNLRLLNDFLKAYGGFDVDSGKFSLYTEMATKDRKFKGYVKPIIKNLKVLGPQNRNDSFLQKAWEVIVSAVATVLKNQKEDQIATKIPIEGSYDNPQTNIFEAILQVLRNAFIQALMPGIDHELKISIGQGQNKPEEKQSFFQKIFSSGKKDKGKK